MRPLHKCHIPSRVKSESKKPVGRPSTRPPHGTAGAYLFDRRESLGENQTEFGRRIGASKDQVGRYERSGHVPRAAAEIAERRLGLEPGFLLLYGRTSPRRKQTKRATTARQIPVVSWVMAGQLADPQTQVPEGSQTIEFSGLEPGDYFATRVRGDSMDRISPEGSLILVNRAEREPLRGRRYIFMHRGETTYKKYETDPVRFEPESTVPANRPIFPRHDQDWSVVGRVRLTLLDDL